jgi:hypothetical protein
MKQHGTDKTRVSQLWKFAKKEMMIRDKRKEKVRRASTTRVMTSPMKSEYLAVGEGGRNQGKDAWLTSHYESHSDSFKCQVQALGVNVSNGSKASK